jgi:hypothetical protein
MSRSYRVSGAGSTFLLRQRPAPRWPALPARRRDVLDIRPEENSTWRNARRGSERPRRLMVIVVGAMMATGSV